MVLRNRITRQKPWTAGLCNVGRYVAGIAKGFGMNVYAFDPFVDIAAIESDGVHALKTWRTLQQMPVCVLTYSANAQTKKSVNFEFLSKMPKELPW